MLLYKVIGRHLRSARKRLKLTQLKVADRAGMPLEYYGSMERGEICPNIDKLASVCKILRISMSSVFEGAEESMLLLDNIKPTDDEFVSFVIAISAHLGEKGKHAIMVMCQEITKMKE